MHQCWVGNPWFLNIAELLTTKCSASYSLSQEWRLYSMCQGTRCTLSGLRSRDHDAELGTLCVYAQPWEVDYRWGRCLRVEGQLISGLGLGLVRRGWIQSDSLDTPLTLSRDVCFRMRIRSASIYRVLKKYTQNTMTRRENEIDISRKYQKCDGRIPKIPKIPKIPI